MADLVPFFQAMTATEPNKLHQMSSEKVMEYEQYFAEQLPRFGIDAQHQQYRHQCQARMDSLRREIQHRQASGIGKKTLTWARIGGVTGIVLILIGIFPLIRDIFFSKVRHAKTERASPTTPLQIPTPTSASPGSAASSSTATPSPEPAATTKPSESEGTP